MVERGPRWGQNAGAAHWKAWPGKSSLGRRLGKNLSLHPASNHPSIHTCSSMHAGAAKGAAAEFTQEPTGGVIL